LAGCVQFCQLSFKYLFTVVGDDSPERPSVQQRHLRMGAGKSSRAVAMQKGSYVLYTLLSYAACMWVVGMLNVTCGFASCHSTTFVLGDYPESPSAKQKAEKTSSRTGKRALRVVSTQKGG